MLTGVLYALAAGLMWGLVFICPLILPDYPPILLACGRYLAFGIVTLPLAFMDRAALRELTKADWRDALKLAVVGNLIYYTCLSAAIQHSGGALPTMIIGTLPASIAISANIRDGARDGTLPWKWLLPSLALICLGIAGVNHSELRNFELDDRFDLTGYATGALLAVGAAACWTWYPLRNADWLRNHPGRSPRIWATAQGLATLPLAITGYGLVWIISAQGITDFPMPLGPTPLKFAGLMFTLGLFASWGGTMCWNQAALRLPSVIAGQLIVFETIAALAYVYLLRGTVPDQVSLCGIILMMIGVLIASQIKPEKAVLSG
jgi:drug/metabolite transporter (DMT)-like permease